MANLTESPIYEPGIFQLEKTTPPLGGAPAFNGTNPSAGHANVQAFQLANRTAWLKQQLESAGSAATLASDLANNSDTAKGATLIGFDSTTVNDILNTVRPLASYNALRSYSGSATIVRITNSLISGFFYYDPSDTTSVDVEGLVLVDISGRRWKRDFKGPIFATWCGVSGTDIGPAINRAGTYLSNIIGGGEIFVPSGNWTTSIEIKIPSFVRIFGEGLSSKITAISTLPVNQNTITNSKNNRTSRTDYNEFIQVEDIFIDSNVLARDPAGTGSLNDQGCGIKFSTVRNSRIARVKSINAPLHCFDICASVYLDNGNINSQPDGPSLDIVVEDCVAIDPQRDDGITTHNSGRIQINRCKSFYNGTPGATQQGVEIDEGSWEVSVTDCYVKNYQKGYQAKGHDTTIPAVNVTFTRCVAEGCTYGFEAAHIQVGTVLPAGQVYWARNIAFVDCVSINCVPSATYAQCKDLSLTGYIGLSVRNFVVYGTQGIITIDRGADHVHIKGVKFKDGSVNSGSGTGRIYIYAPSPAVPNGQTVTIEDVVAEVPMAGPLIRATSSACRKRIRNITAYGTNSSIAMMEINVGSQDSFSDLYQSGYLCAMQPTSNTAYQFDNSLRLDPGLRYSLSGTSAPEGVVTAPLATIYHCTGNGNIYRKSTAASPFNTGWVAM